VITEGEMTGLVGERQGWIKYSKCAEALMSVTA
jgi:hypothetical protein